MDNKSTQKENEQTRKYYDESDEMYRRLWGKDGRCRWGIFTNDNFSVEEAQDEATNKLLSWSTFDSHSQVLDIGCGNGTTIQKLIDKFDCCVDGIDISGVRIAKAQSSLREHIIRDRVNIFRGDAEELPFRDKRYTHVISQSTIYHIKNKERVFSEIFRTLRPEGELLLDDIMKPKKEKYQWSDDFYERLGFDTVDESTYLAIVENAGLRVSSAEFHTENFIKTYREVAKRVELLIGEMPEHRGKLTDLKNAYQGSACAAEKGEIEWRWLKFKKGK